MSNVNYANLVMGADTRGLLKGKDALEATTKAGANTDKAVRGVDGQFKKAGDTAGKASTKVDGFAKAAERTKGAAAAASKSLGIMTAAVGAAASAVAALAGASRIIREFDSSMSQVAAITRATASELEDMRGIAKELGRTTEFSAAQAADGLKFLGMAGFKASESMAALPAVLDLATAAAMDLGSAADIASNIMSGFGIDAGEASTVADILAAASSRANTSVQQLGGAMSTVAPIAAALEIDLADTAAAISAMSDAGIQGERAGTALRGVLASLAGPTKQATDALASYGLTAAQVDPQAHSLAEIFTALRERGLSTADAMTIFGREAASGALVLVEASDRVDGFAQDLREAEGAAGDMADTMRDNLGGDAKSLQSALEGLAIAIGEAGLTAVLRGALQAATGLARGFTAMVEVFSTAASGAVEWVRKMTTFGMTANEAKAATVTLTAAMAEEQVLLNLLTQDMAPGISMSREMAITKLDEAESRMANIRAAQQEQIQLAKSSEEYRVAAHEAARLEQAIDQSLESSWNQDFLGDLPAQTNALVLELYEAQQAQADLLGEASKMSPEYLEAQEKADALRAAIEASADNTVTLEGNTAGVVSQLSIAERVAAALEGYIVGSGNAAGGAAQNASALSGVLLTAAQSALGLYGALSAAMGALGAVGSGLSRLASNAGGVIGVTSRLGGVLGNVLGGSAMQSAISHIADAGRNLATMHSAAVRAAPGIERLNKSLSGGGGGEAASKAMSDAAKDIERTKDAYDSLIGSLDPAVAASQEFAAAQEAINAALKIGYISAGEAANAMSLAKERLSEAMAEANAASGIWEGFEDSARSAFGSVITGASSAKDAIASLLSSLAGKLADSAFDGLFGGIDWGGGGSKGGLFGGSIIPGILHDGGIAGKDGYGHGRAFAAANFDNAPRYHNGGIAGLKPNEVPAILERGERVIPKGQSGGDGGTSFTYAPQIDARGADAGAVQRLEAAMARAHSEFEDRAINAFNMGKKRRKIV